MGLNLNYTPNRLVDITTLTEDQWLSWRRKGIGGSDVAVALNSSPYRTARDLYYDKIGVVMSDDGPDKSITFQIGHLLEDVVAQIFAKKTGLSVYEDHWMYQHPFFPFLIADVDRFVTLPDGRKAILECKTAHYDMQFKWANGAVPRHYELQVRHYMSVMNIDVAFIACLFSNNENDFVWQKIERDIEEEENTIMELSAFWNNHVMARVEPPLVEKPDAVLESLRRYFGPADKSEPTVDLDRKFVVNLKEILALKEEKRALDAQVKTLETRIKSLYAPIVEEMGTACKGTCEQGGECFKVSYAEYCDVNLHTAYEELCKIFGPDGGEPVRKCKRKPRSIETVELPIASAEVRDNTYSNLLSLLTLCPTHQSALKERGLKSEEMELLCYRTTPTTRLKRIVTELLERGCILDGVPGFYCQKDSGQWVLDIRGSGIMLPDRNLLGQIEAIQVRLDKVYNQKFYNLTSVDQYYGTQSKCCPHYVGVHEGDEVVCLTEGVMKSDLAYSFAQGSPYECGFVGLTGIPSYSQYERALEELDSIGVKRINVMVDSDYQVKEEVRKARDRYIEMGAAAGFEMAPITWTQKQKGVDDLYKHLFRDK